MEHVIGVIIMAVLMIGIMISLIRQEIRNEQLNYNNWDEDGDCKGCGGSCKRECEIPF